MTVPHADLVADVAAPGSSLLDRLRQRAVALLGRHRVRGWLARFPLSRPVARWHARRLFDLTAGFVYTQILAAFVELELAEALAAGPRSPSELAAARQLPAPAMERLLSAAAALGLVRTARDGRVALTAMGAALLDNDGLRAMVSHHRVLYRDLADPVAVLRGAGGELASFWPYAGRSDPGALGADDVARYSRLMTESASLVIDQVLDACPLSRHRHLLDVGGGEGAFAEAALLRTPNLRATVFDLPAVADRAIARMRGSAAAARFQAVGGDFRRDPLPPGADVISLVRVLHDHDDATAGALIGAARRALAPGGRLLIAEPFADGAQGARTGDAYFGFYLGAMGQGHCRSVAAYRGMCAAAGFARMRERRTALPLQSGLLIADL